MYKKTITYTDYNGVERTEDFYFHLSKAKIVEMEAGESGGYGEMLKRIIDSKDGPTIMKVFKKFILDAYGIKSPDGKRFMQSEEISKEFEETEAYSELFMLLCTDPNAASEFVNSVLPLTVEQRKEAEAMTRQQKAALQSGN